MAKKIEPNSGIKGQLSGVLGSLKESGGLPAPPLMQNQIASTEQEVAQNTPVENKKKDRFAKYGLAYTFRISHDLHLKLKALSWYGRVTDKEIIETALKEYFDRKADAVSNALRELPVKEYDAIKKKHESK